MEGMMYGVNKLLKQCVFVRVHDVKYAVVSKKNATKLEMIKAAVALYPEMEAQLSSTLAKDGYNGKAEHIADAIAVFQAFTKTPSYTLMTR